MPDLSSQPGSSGTKRELCQLDSSGTGASDTETSEKIGRAGNLSTGTGREYEPERVFTTVKLLELSANTTEKRLTTKKAITRTIKNVFGLI